MTLEMADPVTHPCLWTLMRILFDGSSIVNTHYIYLFIRKVWMRLCIRGDWTAYSSCFEWKESGRVCLCCAGNGPSITVTN